MARLNRRLGYVFIATYGRSGSTLLQGILNSAPGVLVRGENAGAPVLLWRYHRRLTRHHNRVGRKELTPQHPWFGIDGFPGDVSVEHIRQLLTDTLLRPEKGTRIVGYKDIAWPRSRVEIVEYAQFLQTVFPGARFVVNTRDIAATARSGWWGKDPESAEKIQHMHEVLLFLLQEMPESTYHVHYDDYVADPGLLAGLFGWLDLDFDRKVIEDVMAVKHSYQPRMTLEE